MTKVALIQGGKSAEHDVSLRSAAYIGQVLREIGCQVEIFTIARNGEWDQPFLDLLSNDLAFPMVHGKGGEDGQIMGMLETLGIPYIGCEPDASALGMHKPWQKSVLRQAGLPVVDWASGYKLQDVESHIKSWSFPLFVKPARGGSSQGISKVESKNELANAWKAAQEHDDLVIIEKGLIKPRELELALTGPTENPFISIVGEVIPKRDYYDEIAKYSDQSTQLVAPAAIDPQPFQDLAKQVYQILGLRDFCRIDFFDDRQGKIYINEVNTIPGCTETSFFPRLLQESGVSITSLLQELVTMALAR